MPPRSRLLVSVARIAAMLFCAHATANGQRALAVGSTTSLVVYRTTSGGGPTVQYAAVGVHRIERLDAGPFLVAPSAAAAIGQDARRNVMIATGLVLIAALIVGGETGWKLGALSGLLALTVAVG